jgi:hypothetical protein
MDEEYTSKEEKLREYIGPDLFGKMVDAAFRCAYLEAKYLCIPYDGEYFREINNIYREKVVDELIGFVEDTRLKYGQLQKVVKSMIPDDESISEMIIRKYEREED